MLAGEDTKALERLSRFKSPTDVAKSYMELEAKLSQRPSLMTALPEDAKPEQVAEYRKAKGVPAEATLEAYGVKAPDGYDLNDGEKALLGEVVKDLHGKHYGPKEVNDVLGHYFKAQAATIQNQRKIAIDRQKEWTSAMQGELGRDYEPTIAAASSYLNNQFADKPEVRDEILMAQLPGGGRLGDHPAFIRMVADLAVQNGYTDRIEASSLESGGKSLQQQQQELEALRMTNSELYNAPTTQAKLDKIISLRLSRGEIDESGNEKRRR